mmetsp:Transcript_16612/g.24969  ORF Transcript_16612/g.24969 Transcript_16612/m.24969 type:complete len:306 (+) Transcript_16612:8-925(+)
MNGESWTIKVVAASAVVSSAVGLLILKSGGYFTKMCRDKSRNLGVVITGSTRGLGRAMAKEFLLLGDRVVISGRNPDIVQKVIAELEQETNEKVFGHACDVCDSASVDKLAHNALEDLGSVDIWVNNAGVTYTKKQPLIETDMKELERVFQTNTLGTIYGCRSAMRLKIEDKKADRLNIFNVDGSGSRGNSTANSLAYGASKACIPQITKTLTTEARRSKLNVGVHVMSPGMVTTDLLLGRADKRALKIFNILAERPETAAQWLVPAMRGVKSQGSQYLRYLTPPGVIWRFATAPWRKNRIIKVD